MKRREFLRMAVAAPAVAGGVIEGLGTAAAELPAAAPVLWFDGAVVGTRPMTLSALEKAYLESAGVWPTLILTPRQVEQRWPSRRLEILDVPRRDA